MSGDLRFSGSLVFTIDVTGPRAVRSALDVLRVRGVFLAIRLDGHDNQLGLGQPAEQLRQLGLHLLRCTCDRDRGSPRATGRAAWGWLCNRRAKRLQVLIAQLLAIASCCLSISRHLLQSDLVDLFRRHVGGGGALHHEGVDGVAVGQRPDAHFGAALGGVFLLHEVRELRDRPGTTSSWMAAKPAVFSRVLSASEKLAGNLSKGWANGDLVRRRARRFRWSGRPLSPAETSAASGRLAMPLRMLCRGLVEDAAATACRRAM